MMRRAAARLRSASRRHRTAVSCAGALVVAGALALALASDRAEFTAAVAALFFAVSVLVSSLRHAPSLAPG